MTAPTFAAGSDATTARFGRLEQRGLLLGLGLGQLVVLAVALLVAVTGVYSAGMAGLGAAAVLWLPLLTIATVKVSGRTLLSWIPVAASWRARSLLGFTGEITRAAPVTRLRVPGIPSELGVCATASLGAALVHDRRTDSVTAIARVSGSGFMLDAPATQSHKVETWGRALATLGQLRSVRRIQLIVRTVPGGEGGARRWWRDNATTGAPWAASVLAELLDNAFYLTRRTEALLVVALRPPRRGTRHI